MAINLNHVLNTINTSGQVLRITDTGAIVIAKGSTAQRPGTPEVGMMRYNTTTNAPEVYAGASPSWQPLQMGAPQGGLSPIVAAIIFGS